MAGIGYTNLPKQPWEEKRISHDFTQDLAAGDTIASVDSIDVFDASTGAEVTAAGHGVKPGSEQVDGGSKSVSAVYIGGEDGQAFKARARVVTAGGEKLEGDLIIKIADL